MIKLAYDNLEDAKGKLSGTYCLYKGKAFTVKTVYPFNPEEPDHNYYVDGANMFTGNKVKCSIDDPGFNCSDYNIGYINRIVAACWFYRVPAKQYKQGLNSNQIQGRASRQEFHAVEFKPGQHLARMLENDYPKFENAAQLLKDKEANILAFHKDFAMTFDDIHDDYIFEYKGEKIGYSHNMKDFKLLKEYNHLTESLIEVVNAK